MPRIFPPRPLSPEQRYALLKRGFDFSFSLLVVVLILSWLAPLLGLLLKLESRGPVFFKQLRTGKHCQPFYCLKFRSMRLNSEADARQASRGDSRITRLGAFIRQTSLDELPQFINVLRGDMSVVGPRPHMLLHTQDYAQRIAGFMERHAVTPGITGWAQVKGYHGETRKLQAMENRVQADLWYIKRGSLALDVRIVGLTVVQALRGHQNAC
ncbi:sugar transferase [Hymenobacter sp. BT188]|uniref:sugar transferase n=1 Tax=Hymenobacter sp. BT188 TaxID=2763504 RepID=UPI001651905C|nr:sugar transferase [Hymenobacter sp. BT188]MBC6608756.1 sugar transferase [Hymenobacter sp. BT188]